MLKGLFVLAVACVLVVSASDGGDVSSDVSEDTFACLRNNGWNFVIVRSYCSFGGIDDSAPGTLAAAQSAGIPYRDVYHFPCMGKVGAADQIRADHEQVAGQYGMMWIDVDPLWYPHYDGVRSFGDFSGFGGWDSPAIKQYGDSVGICDVNADANWYPDSARRAFRPKPTHMKKVNITNPKFEGEQPKKKTKM